MAESTFIKILIDSCTNFGYMQFPKHAEQETLYWFSCNFSNFELAAKLKV
jgi:hypothetical protein